MKPARTIVLDNEAVQALADPSHEKHRRILAVIEAAVRRNLQRVGSVSLVVPAAVQVEAGWNRTRPRAAALNRLRVERPALGGSTADAAAGVGGALGVSVADAHLAVTPTTTSGPHAVLTSDRPDIRRGADHVGVPVTIVTI